MIHTIELLFPPTKVHIMWHKILKTSKNTLDQATKATDRKERKPLTNKHFMGTIHLARARSSVG